MNMPQNNWKSVVYRRVEKSVHVDVPSDQLNDLTQCASSRKSETCWSLKDPMVDKKIILEGRKGSGIADGGKKEMAGEGVSESSSTSSLQLLQVTREAQKVNQMIDVWSKGLDLDDQSRNIAQDLLRSALKLQESLAMLGRLQEASKFMSRLKKAAKPKYEDYGRVGVSANDMGSSQVANHQERFYPRRHSIDGTSKTDSFRELKKVHRDGLSDRMFSSTRESSFRNEGFRAEEIGSGRFEYYDYGKRLEKKLSSADDVESTRNCMEEVKKVIQDSLVKQNLLSLSSDEEKSSSGGRQYDVLSDMHSSGSGRSFSDLPKSDKKVEQPMKASKPRNLIAKLMGLEEFPSEMVHSTPLEPETKNNYNQRKPVFDIQMPKVIKTQTIDRAGDRGRKELKEIIDNMRYKGLLKVTQTKEYPLGSRTLNVSEELPPIVIIKPMSFSSHEDEEEREKVLTDSAVREMRHSDLKQVPSSSSKEIKNVEAGEKISSKAKTPAQSKKAQERANANTRKLDKTDKGVQNRRNLVEKQNGKSLQVLSSQMKPHSTQTTKPDIQCSPKRIRGNKSVITPNKDLARSRKSASESSVDPTPRIGTKTGKVQKRNSAVNPIAKKKIQKEDERSADRAEGFLNSSITAHMPDELVKKLGQDDCNDSTKEYTAKDGKSLFEAWGEADLCGASCASTEDNSPHIEDRIKVSTTSEMHQQYLLLKTPLFLNRVEELFNLKTEKRPELIPLSTVGKGGIDNTRILLDCANELLERKSYQMSLLSHPLLQTHMRYNRKISLDHLVDEVIDGIETLKCYSKSDIGSSQTTDHPYLILGKDLMCKSIVVNGVWNMGWLHGFSIEEAELVLYEVEKDVVCELIEEMVKDLARRFR